MICPICGKEGATLRQWDFGRDPDTGYYDQGEELSCPACGDYQDKEIERAIDQAEETMDIRDICAFCKMPIGDDEATFEDDQGNILHLTCAEVEAEEKDWEEEIDD